jgi:hypothetical protein
MKKYFEQLKEKNPNANVKNLVAGVVFLLVAILFSGWLLMSQSGSDTNPEEGGILDSFFESLANDSDEESTENQDQNANTETEGMEEVLPGEGLYSFSERVCGFGEFYPQIAELNNLDMNANLEVGQMLSFSCETFGINK